MGTLLAAACGSGAEPQAPTPAATVGPTAKPAAQPSLVIASGSQVSLVVDGRAERTATVDGQARIAYLSSDGFVVEVRAAEAGRLVLVDDDQTTIPTPDGDDVTLHDVAPIDGADHVVYTAFQLPEDDEPRGELYLQRLGSQDRVEIAAAVGPEYGVERASLADGVIVASAVADLTERFAFYDLAGRHIEGRPNPTDDLPYGEPPYLTQAVLSPDGEMLAYIEGVDFDQTAQRRVGTWSLVLIDQDAGDELLRLDLGAQRDVVWLDHDGRWAVVSFDDGVGLIDTTADDPSLQAVDAEGLATIA